MNLRSVHAGDIVLIGAAYHAKVVEVLRGAVLVKGIGNGALRRVPAREIAAHWRLTTNHRKPDA